MANLSLTGIDPAKEEDETVMAICHNGEMVMVRDPMVIEYIMMLTTKVRRLEQDILSAPVVTKKAPGGAYCKGTLREAQGA